MKSKNVLIRTDASNLIGTGHVIRCLTIADHLKNLGANVEFICREHVGNLIPLITEKGFQVHKLSISGSSTQSQWLGSSILEDVEQTLECIQNQHFDWIIVDHYALNKEWESVIRKKIKNVFVIDDLANRDHDCDILLDQNFLGTITNTRYDKLTPSNCKKLLGPQYAILDPSYKKLRRSLIPKVGDLQKILVFLGGADQSNETSKVLEALTDTKFDSIEVEVVLGKNHPNPQEVRSQASKRKNTYVLENLPNLSEQMINADLMIGAGGTTTWERMCLGLPSIVMSIADNQTAINQALSQADLISYLGVKEEVSIPQIKSAIMEYLNNPTKAHDQAAKIIQLVNGEGTDAVCATLFNEGNI
jgi:UDP-2,4-diacetamido-2,4,6-trideoxy-beta-L-altropyranose hydrolase